VDGSLKHRTGVIFDGLSIFAIT